MSINSRIFRSKALAIFCTFLLTYAPVYATAGVALKSLGHVLQQIKGRPGPYSDVPRPVDLGKNPSRDADHRGGLFTDAQIAFLNKLAQEDALKYGDVQELWASMDMAALGMISNSQGMQYAGAVHGWERELGAVNSNTGNRMQTIPIVGWQQRGGSKLSVSLIHNSKANLTTQVGKAWRINYDSRLSFLYDADGFLVGVTVIYGDGTTIAYTSADNGATFTAPAGIYDVLAPSGANYTITRKDQAVWTFNSSGYATSFKDRAGNTTTINRSGSIITSISDPNGRAVTFTQSGSFTTTITDPLSRTWSLTINGSNDLTQVALPVLSGTTYTHVMAYNSAHCITSYTNPRAKTWTYAYDTGYNLTSETDPLSQTKTYTPGTTNYVLTLPGGQATTNNYSSGVLASEVDPGGFSDSYTYNSNHNVLTHTDGRGKVWTYTYDSKGNVLTEKNPLNQTTTYTYNSTNDPLTVKDALNNTTTMTYNSVGRVLTVVNPLSQTRVTNTYDSFGQLLTTKDALNNTTTNTYDTNGNLTNISDPLSHSVTIAYDSLSRKTSATDTLGNTESITYDAWSRPITLTHPGSSHVDTTYDANGNVLTVADELGHTTTKAYDNLDRLTSVTNPRGDVESYGYNANNWLTSVTNGRGYARNYVYNTRGQLYSLTMPDSALETWTYDGEGNLSAYTNPLSQTISYGYDDAGRRTLTDYPTGTDTTFAYDSAGRQTSMVDATGTSSFTYDNASQVTALTTPQGSLTYGYDVAGRKTSMVQTGVGTTTYGYDAASRLTSLTNPYSEVTSYTYDNANRTTKRTLSAGQYEDVTYDTRSRMTGVTVKNSGGTALHTTTYGIDNASRITSVVLDGVTTTYGYDNADQLTSEGNGTYSISYAYDANGNRSSRTVNGLVETYSVDNGDKLNSVTWSGGSKTYGYDAAGRTTSVVTGAGTTSLAYDYEGRVTTITYPGSSTNTFTYNGLDTRVGKVDSGGTKTFFRSGVGVTDPVLSDSAANYTPGVSERRGSTTTFSHSGVKNADIQTSTAQVSTGTRNYDAFGNVVASSGTWGGPFGYAGKFGYQEDSDSGLKLLGHRYYDSSTGRFITRDPAKAGRNWYGYCDGNPLLNSDASGLDPAIGFDPRPHGTGYGLLIAPGYSDPEGQFVMGSPVEQIVKKNGTIRDYIPKGHRTFHLDYPHNGVPDPHFNADGGPLQIFNHQPVPGGSMWLGKTIVIKGIGGVLVAIAVAEDINAIVHSPDPAAETVKRGLVWANAALGAEIGTGICPGVGTIAGGIIGAAITIGIMQFADQDRR